jgi:hypothetical protein
MSDPAKTPAPPETRLSPALMAQRLADMQTIFVERMRNIQEYIEQIEKDHQTEIDLLKERVRIAEAKDVEQDALIRRLSAVESAVANKMLGR